VLNLGNNIIIFDGAMGSEIQKTGYTGSPEALNLENNDFITSVHRKYIQAGADIITTNTFGANRSKLLKYNLGEKVNEIIESAFLAAKKAGEGLEKKYRIALDVGPTGKLLKPYGDTYFDEIYDVYKECALAAKKLDLDYIILETFSQLSELRAAFLAFKENTDISFSNYIIDKKFDYAASVLQNDLKISVSDVAGNLGYFDKAYFTRQFKARYGMTPLQYRKAKNNS
jgi:5-methyltetrahydrofolate--homocysteine methyltransferase